MSFSPCSAAAEEENTKSPQACDATPVDMKMLGGGVETLPSWRWMLPHVSLCFWCVPWLEALHMRVCLLHMYITPYIQILHTAAIKPYLIFLTGT